MAPATRSRWLRHGALLWASSAAAALLALAVQVVAARHLAPAHFGEIASWLALHAVIGSLGHFGLGTVILRRSTEDPADAARWTRGALRFALALSATGVALLLALGIMGRTGAMDEGLARWWPLWLLPVAFSTAFAELAIARQQVLDRPDRVALLQLAPNALRLAGVVAAVLAWPGEPSVVALVLGLASLLAAAVALHGTRRSLPDPGAAAAAAPGLVAVLREAWPYGAAGVLYLLLAHSPVLLLRAHDQPAAAGFFALATSVLAAVYLLPGAIFTRLAARTVAVWVAHDRPRLRAALPRFLGGAAMLGLVSAAIVGLAAQPLVHVLFGTRYEAVAAILGTLLLAVPARCVSIAAAPALVTPRATRQRLAIQAAVLALFALAGTAVISGGGAHAALHLAVAFVAAEGLQALAYASAAFAVARPSAGRPD